MKNILVKIFLITFSLVLFLLTIELLIRLYVLNLNSADVFVANHRSDEMIRSKELSRNYDRNSTFEIFTSNSSAKSEIIAVGDSFTNGGNLSAKHSYPFHLYNRFKGTTTVRNMGECESTSFKAFKNIQTFYKSKNYNSDTNYLFVILTGVADLMNKDLSSDFNYTGKQSSTSYIHKDVRSFIDYTGFSSNFKSIQLIQYLFGRLTLSTNQNSIELSDKAYSIIRKCSELPENERVQCTFKLLKPFKSFKVHEPVVGNLFMVTKIDSSLDYSKRINYIFKYLEAFGSIVPKRNYNDLIFEVALFYYQLQSQITLEEILSKIDIISTLYPNKLDVENLNKFKYWAQNSSQVKSSLFDSLDSIVSITKQHNDFVLLATYPLEYKIVNMNIREYALNFNIPLIDLEKSFKSRDISKLIQDGEHCNKDGYKLMADEIFLKIKSLY